MVLCETGRLLAAETRVFAHPFTISSANARGVGARAITETLELSSAIADAIVAIKLTQLLAGLAFRRTFGSTPATRAVIVAHTWTNTCCRAISASPIGDTGSRPAFVFGTLGW